MYESPDEKHIVRSVVVTQSEGLVEQLFFFHFSCGGMGVEGRVLKLWLVLV